MKPISFTQWIDITQAATERRLIDKSPAAYFMYYIDRKATPPDWWHELKRKERQQEADQQRASRQFEHHFSEERGFDEYLKTEAREAFDRVMQNLVSDFVRMGKQRHEAERIAHEHTLVHFRNKYRKEKQPLIEQR